MSILYFISAIKMKIWQTSLNSFVVVSVFFIITISHEFEVIRHIWISYHVTIFAIMLTFIMGRVTYQSICTKKMKDKTNQGES